MPVHREKDAGVRGGRTPRKNDGGDRPIITQEKAKATTRKKKETTMAAAAAGRKVEQKPSGAGDAKTRTYLKDVLERKSKKKPEETKVARHEEKRRTEVPRNRTRTRTLSPTEVKQLLPSKLAKKKVEEAEEAKKREEEEKRAEAKEKEEEKEEEQEEQEEEEEEEYEDDFEDYESDFEEDSEEAEEEEEEEEKAPATVIEPMSLLKESSRRKEMEEIRMAMKMENDRTCLSPEAAPIPRPKATLEALAKRSQERKVAEKARKRGEDLLGMISLDAITYSFLDLPSVPYEVYMKVYGRQNTKQAHVQTNEDDLDEETQTDEIHACDKWVQKPPNATRLTKEERMGVGGDGGVSEREPSMCSVDPGRLSEFVVRAGHAVLAALDRKTGNRLDESLASSKLVFSDGYVSLGLSALPFLANKSVAEVCCSADDIMLSVHIESSGRFGESIIAVWNVNDLSEPMKVLTAGNRVTSTCLGAQHGSLVLSGLADGTVCLWDLKESSALHRTDSGWTMRSPTYTTGHRQSGHLGPVVSVRILQSGDTDHGDFAPVQVCSLEESGTIIIWSVVRGRSLRNVDEDIGLAHWGKVKLVQSSSFTTGKGGHVSCTDLALQGSDELYVAETSGEVCHVSRYGTLMKPKRYGAGSDASATCLETCPFDSNYFLTGCNDGSIRLHYRGQERALISLTGVARDEDGRQAAVVALSWLFVRPFVFFALDSLSRIHVWNLGVSDMYPEITLSLGKEVTCVKLMQTKTARGKPHLVIATKDGSVEIHRLKSIYGSRTPSEIHLETKKFLRYVSIL